MQRRPILSLIVAGVATSNAFAQPNVLFHIVAKSGDRPPGLAETATFTDFETPSIGNDGTLSFRARVSEPGTSSAAGATVFAGTVGDLVLVARGDEAPPGVADGSVFVSNAVSTFSLANAAGNGHVALGGFIRGADSVIREALIAGHPSTPQVIAMSGQPLPGALDGATINDIDLPQFGAGAFCAMDDLGNVACRVTLSGATSTTDAAIIYWNGSSLVTLAREGELVPEGVLPVGTTYKSFGRQLSVSDGRVAFSATLTPGGSGSAVFVLSEADGSIIAAPFENLPPPEAGQYLTAVEPRLNNDDAIAFFGTSNLSPGGGNAQMTVAGPSGALSVATLRSNTIPSLPGELWGVAEPVVVGGSGAIAFRNSTTGPGAAPTIFTGLPTGPQPVARLGESSPLADTTYDDFNIFGAVPSINERGTVAFGAFLAGSGVTLDTRIALFATDADGMPFKVIQYGDAIDFGSGDMRTVNLLRFGQGTGTQDGFASGMNDLDQLLFTARFTNGTWAVVRASIGGVQTDLDGDGATTISDLLQYLALWFSEDPDADIAPPDGVTVADLLAFLSCWFRASSGGVCS